jgi:hypothetical protein
VSVTAAELRAKSSENEQFSLKPGKGRFTEASQSLGLVYAVMGAGVFTTGDSRSSTRNTIVAVLLFPAQSVASYIMVCKPTPKVEEADGG